MFIKSHPNDHQFQFPMTNLECDHSHQVYGGVSSVSQPVKHQPVTSDTQQLSPSAVPFIPSDSSSLLARLNDLKLARLRTIAEENSKDIVDDDDDDELSLHPLSLSADPETENEVNLSPCSQSSSYSSSYSFAANYNLDSVPNSTTSSDMAEEKKEDFEEESWVDLDDEDEEEIDEDEEDDNLWFEPKFKGNPAKGNFFISKPNIARMINECTENFITDAPYVNDEKLAFDYFKQSVAMQINDRQVRIHRTAEGKIIILDIDLHFAANQQRMFLIAMLNKREFRHKVKWQIVDFMTKHEIADTFGVYQVPKSSRNMRSFKGLLAKQPCNVPMDIVDRTVFHKLPGKKSRRKASRQEQQESVQINEAWLKYCCKASWNNNIMIPVVVIKGQRQWIEWKKLICVGQFYVAISLRYYPSNRKWRIECMDYDGGRIYYQHRLIGVHKLYNYSYGDLASCVKTSLKILKN